MLKSDIYFEIVVEADLWQIYLNLQSTYKIKESASF